MRSRVEPVTLVLIVACAVPTVGAYAFGRGAADLGRWGALAPPHLWIGEYWRIPTTILLHGGWLHLFLNALSLWFVGPYVARGLGRGPYVVALALGAAAGLAASILHESGAYPRLGVSGAIAGLIGVILACEWRLAGGRPLAFLKRRNTLVIGFLILLSVGIGFGIEKGNPNVRIDHAAHVGGVLAGFLATILYLAPRGGTRRVAGGLAALALGALPLLYVCYPVLDPGFLLYRAQKALSEGRRSAAEHWFARLHDRDPGQLEAGARLALMRDDPACLEGLRPPQTLPDGDLLLGSFLELAAKRFEKDPGQAAALVERAVDVRPSSWHLWRAFGVRAFRAGATGLAETALHLALERGEAQRAPLAERGRTALLLLPLQGNRLRTIEPASPERVRGAIALVRAARAAAAAMAIDDPGESNDLERTLKGALELGAGIEREQARARPVDGALRELRRSLRAAYERLAAVVEERSLGRAAAYRLQAAEWWWQSVAGTDALDRERTWILNVARGAWEDAGKAGDDGVRALAARWLERHGAAPERGDLAPRRDGG